MKERGILFSAPMVRALLDGSKTQTRRPAKPRRKPSLLDGSWTDDYVLAPGNAEWLMRDNLYGQPGDGLWVRESYRFTDVFDSDSPTVVGERCLDVGYTKPWAPIQFDADGARRDWRHTGTPPHNGEPQPGKGRPSIHMPRWASRILLEITGVRVERLQDISEADAVAEGIGLVTDHMRAKAAYGMYYCAMPDGKMHYSDSAVSLYETLWEQINGAGSWDANPWVWVVEFRRLT